MFIQRIIDSGSTAGHCLSAESIEVVMYLIVRYESVSDMEGVEGYEDEPLENPDWTSVITIIFCSTANVWPLRNWLFLHQTGF